MGEAFGEVSIVMNHRRAATVKCLTDCSFVTLSRQDYYWSIGQVKKQQLMAEVKNLRCFSFFKSIRTNQIDKIQQTLIKIQYTHN